MYKDTTDYSRAGEALGQKLLEFADAAPGGVVLGELGGCHKGCLVDRPQTWRMGQVIL